jgi:hypothetical protein
MIRVSICADLKSADDGKVNENGNEGPASKTSEDRSEDGQGGNRRVVGRGGRRQSG